MDDAATMAATIWPTIHLISRVSNSDKSALVA